MNVGSNRKTCRLKRHSEVLLNWSKTAFVNRVYKLFKRLFSYTRLNAKLGFSKTSFVNTAASVCWEADYTMFVFPDIFLSYCLADVTGKKAVSPQQIKIDLEREGYRW